MTTWYLALFAVAVAVCFVGVPLAAWLERRADLQDKRAFERMWSR